MRTATVGWIVGLACGMALVGSAAAAELDLALTVEEPAGVARVAAPASGGVPLPAGQFKPGQPFALFDGSREVPLQTQPLVLDKDGSLRWILLDFQTDLAAGQKKTFTLRAAAPSAVPTGLGLTETADAVTIDTGRAVIVISKTRPFGLFESVSCGGKPVIAPGGRVRYTDAFDGKTYLSDAPSSVQVEYVGPLRATVAVKGRFVGDDQTKLGYVARVTTWAQSTQAHVKYSLANSNPDHYTYRQIRDSSIALKLPGDAAQVTLGASAPLVGGAPATMHAGLDAATAGAAKASSVGDQTWTSSGRGDAAQGWAQVRLADGALYVCDAYFADDPPRRLAVEGDTLTLTGVAQRFEGPKDDRGRERGAPFAGKHRWLMDCSHLSSEYLFDFAPGQGSAELWKVAQNRLHVLAPASWYSETEGLSGGKFGTQADELNAYDTWGWTYDAKRVPTAPGRSYGRFVRGEDNHFETEQDGVDVFLMMYLRTGQRAFFDNLLAWANYNVDLQTWRTNGWQWKDGGVWWRTGPLGNRPQRAADPVTGQRNSIPGSREPKPPFTPESARDLYFLTNAKSCYCHNWGEGLAGWFCITGDRDVLEAVIDQAEQNIDFQRRGRRLEPGKSSGFSRDFTRAFRVINAARQLLPDDPFLVESSDFLAEVYFKRPNAEPRGLVNGPAPRAMNAEALAKAVGPQGIDAMKQAGVTMDPKTGELAHAETGRKWFPLYQPNIWMGPPLSIAMELYYRLTGSEDAQDWTIAYAQGAARVLWQRHGNQHGQLLADFPLRGVVRDFACWTTEPDNQTAEGVRLSGYLAQFHPDVCANGYSLSGEPFLKQRAYDYWNFGSHRPYQGTSLRNMGTVATWVNYYGPHSESVTFTSRTFHIWAHPRTDEQPPAAVTDLAVRLDGDRATVTFTAPADAGGGKVVRYQVKCSDRPIVDYVAFLKHFNDWTDDKATNWWMSTNLDGEPAPGAAGAKERFTVTGVPAGAKYFAVRSFDDSANRSALSNVAEAR